MKDLRSKYQGMTYAAAAQKIDSKYKFRKFDSLQNKAYLEEMKILMKMQEEVMAKRSAKDFALAKATNPEAVMEQQAEMEIPEMKEGGAMPDRYKKMGFSGVNKPKKTPGASKSHAVVVKDGDSYKLIRFGQQGVSGAGKNPKTDKEKARRKSFKARHAKNIAKGKTSAAYWADKVKWAEGGWIQKAVDKMEEKGTEGAFTRSAKQAGMGVQEYAASVLSNPNASTTQKRRANFAKNMASINKKKMQDGGGLSNTFMEEMKKPTYSPSESALEYSMNTVLEGGSKSQNMLSRSMDDVLARNQSPLVDATSTQEGEVTRGKVSEVPTIQSLADQRLEAKNKQDASNFNAFRDRAQSQIEKSAQYKTAEGQYKNRKQASAYDPAIAGSRLNKLINAGIILGGPERRSPVFNPYEGDVMNKVNAMGVDLDPARQSLMSNANTAINRISNMTRSASSLRSNIANIYANMNTGLANVDMQQQQQLNNIRNTQASIINNLGVNRQQSISMSREINDRNRAAWQSEVSRFGASVMDDSKFYTRMQVQEGQNMLMAKILSDSFKDFGLNPDIISKMSKGQFGDLTNQELIELKNKLNAEEFKNFGEVYKQNTGKDVPDVKATTTEAEKKNETVNEGKAATQTATQTTTSNNPTTGAATTSAAPATTAPAKAPTSAQQAIGTAMSAGNNPQPQQQQSNASGSGNKSYTYTPNNLQSTVPGVSDHAYSRLADIMDFELTKGSPQGTGLSNFGNPSLVDAKWESKKPEDKKKEAVEWIAKNIYEKTAGQGTEDERISITDHWYNSGTDARIYAYQEWLKRTDPNNTRNWKDENGNWKDRMRYRNANAGRVGNQEIYGWTDERLKQEFEQLYQQVPTADRRELLKAGRHTHLSGLTGKEDVYKATWQDRIGVSGP